MKEDRRFIQSAQIADSHLTVPANCCDGYVAAAIANFLREELLACERSFAFETVMSHESKVNFLAKARSQGYKTYLYFITTDSAELNVERVKQRVARGGHDVLPEKIRQ